jgi:hypothetical protein
MKNRKADHAATTVVIRGHALVAAVSPLTDHQAHGRATRYIVRQGVIAMFVEYMTAILVGAAIAGFVWLLLFGLPKINWIEVHAANVVKKAS